jgi:hypothetical protein
VRLLWKLITPRGFRHGSLAVLLVWTLVACAHHAGFFAEIAWLFDGPASSSLLLPMQGQSP